MARNEIPFQFVAENVTRTTFREIENDIGGLTRIARRAGRFLGFVGAAIGVARLAGEFAEASQEAAQLQAQAETLGTSFAFVRELQGLGQLLNFDFTELIEGAKTLDERLVEAVNGSEEIVAAFQRLNIDPAELIDAPTEERIFRVAEGLERVDRQVEAVAISRALLSDTEADVLLRLSRIGTEQREEIRENLRATAGDVNEQFGTQAQAIERAILRVSQAARTQQQQIFDSLLPDAAVIDDLGEGVARVVAGGEAAQSGFSLLAGVFNDFLTGASDSNSAIFDGAAALDAYAEAAQGAREAAQAAEGEALGDAAAQGAEAAADALQRARDEAESLIAELAAVVGVPEDALTEAAELLGDDAREAVATIQELLAGDFTAFDRFEDRSQALEALRTAISDTREEARELFQDLVEEQADFVQQQLSPGNLIGALSGLRSELDRGIGFGLEFERGRGFLEAERLAAGAQDPQVKAIEDLIDLLRKEELGRKLDQINAAIGEIDNPTFS